jgi:DNA-binding NarL/FixJ family response regulator
MAKTYNRHQIYGILKDYCWKLREVQRIDKELQKTDFTGTAQYGIEATLPHAVGLVGKAIENEIVRREKKSERVIDYIDEINFINDRMNRIVDEKEKVVLDCLLDGLSIAAVASHLRTSRKQVNLLRDNIVKLLADN